MYYLCSENKAADQLRGYREADLRLCFLHMQKAGFLMKRLIYKASNENTLTIHNFPELLDTPKSAVIAVKFIQSSCFLTEQFFV